MSTRSALCISPPSTIWKSPFNRLFSGAKVGRRGVTILILLVLVVFLWVAVLAPSAWRRFGERQGVGSIDHFHHQLQLLEHAGPKTVAPAYRLHTAMPGGGADRAAAPSVDSSRSEARVAATDGRRRRRRRRRQRRWPLRADRRPRPAGTCVRARGDRRPVGLPARAGQTPLHHVAALPLRCGDLDRSHRDVAGAARRLGLHRPLRAVRPRPGRTHGLRQGAARRSSAAAAPVVHRHAARARAEATSIRRPPAIPVPGTTTTTSRSPGSQHADTACGLFREDLGRPTILGVAGGVAQLAERYVRNVEAVGSNPITSTKSPGQRAEVDPPEDHLLGRDFTCLYGAVRKALMSATCVVFEVEDARRPHSVGGSVLATRSRRPCLGDVGRSARGHRRR